MIEWKSVFGMRLEWKRTERVWDSLFPSSSEEDSEGKMNEEDCCVGACVRWSPRRIRTHRKRGPRTKRHVANRQSIPTDVRTSPIHGFPFIHKMLIQEPNPGSVSHCAKSTKDPEFWSLRKTFFHTHFYPIPEWGNLIVPSTLHPPQPFQQISSPTIPPLYQSNFWTITS